MEKAKGVILSDCWRDLARAAKNKIIEQIVNLQLSFSSRAFPAHGCLFFKEDVPAEKLSFSNVPSDPSQRYTIGPLVDPTLWEDGRNELNVHKGPCLSLIILTSIRQNPLIGEIRGNPLKLRRRFGQERARMGQITRTTTHELFLRRQSSRTAK